MQITDNRNFKAVSVYKKDINIDELVKLSKSEHLSAERLERFERAVALNQYPTGNMAQANVDKIFLVDKGHKDGVELHCVTKRGIIFILNEGKYLRGVNSLITVLIGRPNQIKRLYKHCGLYVSNSIIDLARINQANGENN